MRWIIAILSILFVSLQWRLWLGPGSWEQIVELERELEQQQAINQRFADRNDVLASEIYDLKYGLQGIEERARSDLGLIKQGETFYLLVDSPELRPQP